VHRHHGCARQRRDLERQLACNVPSTASPVPSVAATATATGGFQTHVGSSIERLINLGIGSYPARLPDALARLWLRTSWPRLSSAGCLEIIRAFCCSWRPRNEVTE
jgi:hypothetical protein